MNERQRERERRRDMENRRKEREVYRGNTSGAPAEGGEKEDRKAEP